MTTMFKNKTALAVAAVLLIGALLAALILRGGKTADAHADDHGHGAEAQHADDKPGEKHAEAAVAPEVEISDEQMQRNGVALATVGPARIRSSVQLLGEVKLNDDHRVVVVPRLAGIVESVRVSAGDRVRRGQVLAVLSSQALADQRGEWLAASKRLALARATVEREKKLWEEKISAEQDYLLARHVFAEAEITAESARQKLAALGAAATASTQGLTRFEIRAPIDGQITDKKISVGEVLKDDAAIFQIADLGSVWVELNVPAGEIHRLKVGDVATVKSGDVEATARLSHVGALVGEQSRRAMARLVLSNDKGTWRPGLPVTVELVSGEAEAALAIAADAVQTMDERTVVFVREGTHFEARPVSLGRSDGRSVEVLNGLKAGERYAAKNSYLVKADLGKSGAGHAH